MSHRHRIIIRLPNISKSLNLCTLPTLPILLLYFNWLRCALPTYISHSSWRPPARRRPAGRGGCPPRAASSPASPASSGPRDLGAEEDQELGIRSRWGRRNLATTAAAGTGEEPLVDRCTLYTALCFNVSLFGRGMFDKSWPIKLLQQDNSGFCTISALNN